MGEKLILEVLVPTYKRTKSAIGAIKSVLAADDPRVGISCHSNGIDEELENFLFDQARVNYGYFSENKGAVANFLKVLEQSNAEYVLFLSDEDRVDSQYLAEFLTYLSSRKYAFIHCSVLDDHGMPYFSVKALHGEVLSRPDLLRLFPIDPTYISGYCFRRELLTTELLHYAFDSDEANVYPHLLLRNAVVKATDEAGLFGQGLIIKGEEANMGGDSHSHIDSNATEGKALIAKQLLNPRIYGEDARMAQFLYLEPIIDAMAKSRSFFDGLFLRTYFIAAWLRTTNNAHLYVEPSSESISCKSTRLYGKADGLSQKFYLAILNISNSSIRNVTVSAIWKCAKLVKLLLFISRFGLVKTYRFATGRSK